MAAQCLYLNVVGRDGVNPELHGPELPILFRVFKMGFPEVVTRGYVKEED